MGDAGGQRHLRHQQRCSTELRVPGRHANLDYLKKRLLTYFAV
jgi:hypothetical protein